MLAWVDMTSKDSSHINEKKQTFDNTGQEVNIESPNEIFSLFLKIYKKIRADL